MTTYSVGDVVLAPFPFTDQTATKKRPAVVISSNAYNSAHIDLIVMAISGQVGTSSSFGDVVISDWKNAGLLRPSLVKPVITTIEKSLVIHPLGKLQPDDCIALRNALTTIIDV